jgi:hypothetical protein
MHDCPRAGTKDSPVVAIANPHKITLFGLQNFNLELYEACKMFSTNARPFDSPKIWQKRSKLLELRANFFMSL